MSKFIFILVLAVFGGTGVALLFSDVKLEAPEPVIKADEGDEYAELTVNSDYALSSLAGRIVAECGGQSKECAVVSIYDYIKKNFQIEKYEAQEPSLWKVIREGKGDESEIAMLFEALLKKSGVEPKTEAKEGELKVYACNLDVLKLYDEIRKNMRTKALAGREMALDKDGVWAVELKSKDGAPLAIDIVGEGSGKFDVFLFPSDVEMRDYINGSSVYYAGECFRKGVSKLELQCIAPSGSRLSFISKEDGNIFKGAVFRGGFLLNDIKTAYLGGKKCIDMDMNF